MIDYLQALPWYITAAYLAIGVMPAMIYLDATHHGVGKIPGDDSVSAGAWASAALPPFVGILFAVPYLHCRGELVQQARSCPVVVPRPRRVGTFLLILAAGVTTQGLIVEESACPHRGSPMFDQFDDADGDE